MYKKFPIYNKELELKSKGFKYVAGIDEAGRGCEHPSAEVLTSNGWKYYIDITLDDQVLSCTKDGSIVWQNIDFVVDKEFSGDLMSLSNRSVDVLVTQDHFFDVFRRKFIRDSNNNLKLVGYIYRDREQVTNLRKNDVIPRGGIWCGEEQEFFYLPATNKLKFDHSGKDYFKKKIPMDLWLKFLGIYLAEGSATHSNNNAYVISIKQIKKDILDQIFNTLKELPFDVFKESDRVVIRNKQLYDYLKPLGKAKDKYMPKCFKDLSSRQLDILIDWMLLGDGSSYKGKNRKRVFVYYTTSKKLRDDFEELILKTGRSYNTSERKPRDSYIKGRLIKKENCSPCYEIRIRRNIRAQVKSLHKKFIPYRGKVFCLGLPKHHNFFVRRSGTGYFTGNCGAGPVVAAAVVLNKDIVKYLIGNIRDSKKMSPNRREEMFKVIHENSDNVIMDVDNHTIDSINILQATKLAMRKAVYNLNEVDYLLIDGDSKMNLDIPVEQEQIPMGDDKVLSIAAASILAKVARDRMMNNLHDIYPIYGWNKNKGYLTKEHIEAIKLYGITEFHRVSFKKVGDL